MRVELTINNYQRGTNREIRSKTVFDGASEMKNVSKPISVERAIELESILGKALLERFKKEEEKLKKV